MTTKRKKNLMLKTDFGKIEIDEELLHAVRVIQDAAYTLQITEAELLGILEETPTCPHC